MKITISGTTLVVDAETHELVDRDLLRRLDGVRHSGSELGWYLNRPLLELGITGGTMRLAFSESTGLRVLSDYWAPRRLTDEEAKLLADDTSGQWTDGIGENGFDHEACAGLFVQLEGGPDIEIVQCDDGRFMPPGPRLALVASRGDLDAIRKGVRAGKDLEDKWDGFTALALAINGGHLEAALLLIQLGADVNAVGPLGETPLLECADERDLSDEQSCTLARALLDADAKVNLTMRDDVNALSLAVARGKMKLQELLRLAGASLPSGDAD